MKFEVDDFETIRGNVIYSVEADREPAGKGNMASFANLDQLQAMNNNSDLVKAALHLYNCDIIDESKYSTVLEQAERITFDEQV